MESLTYKFHTDTENFQFYITDKNCFDLEDSFFNASNKPGAYFCDGKLLKVPVNSETDLIEVNVYVNQFAEDKKGKGPYVLNSEVNKLVLSSCPMGPSYGTFGEVSIEGKKAELYFENQNIHQKKETVNIFIRT